MERDQVLCGPGPEKQADYERKKSGEIQNDQRYSNYHGERLFVESVFAGSGVQIINSGASAEVANDRVSFPVWRIHSAGRAILLGRASRNPYNRPPVLPAGRAPASRSAGRRMALFRRRCVC
jgi:hypothetical protein